MKLIIDISEDMFEWFKNGEIIDEYDKSALKQIFKNGIPLDDVIGKIDKAYDDLDGYDPNALCSFANRVSDIFDNIGKADKRSEIRCNTCKNNDDELSGECYECVKNIQNHYEPKRSEPNE